jgi:hypothetical protein
VLLERTRRTGREESSKWGRFREEAVIATLAEEF